MIPEGSLKAKMLSYQSRVPIIKISLIMNAHTWEDGLYIEAGP